MAVERTPKSRGSAERANDSTDRSPGRDGGGASISSLPLARIGTQLSRCQLLALQRTAGNAAVCNLVSTSPTRARPDSDIVQRTLTFPVSDAKIASARKQIEDYVREVNGGADDPKIRFMPGGFLRGNPRFEVDYSAQQLIDQYPRFLDYLNMSGLADKTDILDRAGHKSGVPGVMSDTYGDRSEKEARKANEVAHAGLLHQAITTAQNFRYEEVDSGLRQRSRSQRYETINESADSTSGVLSLLKHEKGVVIGEFHTDDDNRKLLVDLLPHLTKSGVTTIYLEAIRADYQTVVDKYLATALDAPMPAELLRFLQAKGTDGMSYLLLLQRIKAQGGLSVKGIDTLAATSRPYARADDRDMARELAMNEFAASAIRQGSGGSNKYVALVGRAHSNTQALRANSFRATAPVPGLSQLLNVPAVHVASGEDIPKLDEENKWSRYPGMPRPPATSPVTSAVASPLQSPAPPVSALSSVTVPVGLPDSESSASGIKGDSALDK